MQDTAPEFNQKVFKVGLTALKRHLLPFRRAIIQLSVLGILLAVLHGTVPYITGKLLDALIAMSRGESSSGLYTWGTLLLIWGLLEGVSVLLEYLSERRERAVTTKINLGIQSEGFIRLFQIPLLFHKNGHMHGVMQGVSTTSWRVASLTTRLTTIFPQLLSLLIGLLFAAYISPALALILVAGLVVYIVFLLFILRPIAEYDREGMQMWNEAWDDLAQAVHQIEGVKNATSEEY